MAVISEIPDESNGGDPNKKPEEPKEKAENQNKKPKEEVTSFESLPAAITEICVARVQRCVYPALSLTSTAFRHLIASPELYRTRTRLGTTERVLYALIRFPHNVFRPSWYILYRNDTLRLRRIDSLPPMPFGSAVVTIGPEIYVIGGSDGERNTSNVILIDCRNHTHRSLPRMKVARFRAAAGVIDGRIYVMGGCEMRTSDWIEVFDVETQIWVESKWSMNPKVDIEFLRYAVMEKKIYALDHYCSHVFERNGEVWESSSGGYQLLIFWHGSSCVIDDMLYSIDPLCFHENHILVFDPKVMAWRDVKGIDGLPSNLCYHESKMSNFGGKLMILVGCQSRSSSEDDEKNEIWCLEIALERRQGGEIWGNLESVNLVVTTDMNSPSIELCRTLTL